MKKSDIAVAKHDKGYNCAQAVACTFADEVGVDEATLYKMTEAFGAGMGSGLGVCGAMSGAAVVLGLRKSDGNIEEAGGTKKSTYRDVAKLQMEFADRVGDLVCKQIKADAKTSCADCIRIAAELAEEEMSK